MPLDEALAIVSIFGQGKTLMLSASDIEIVKLAHKVVEYYAYEALLRERSRQLDGPAGFNGPVPPYRKITPLPEQSWKPAGQNPGLSPNALFDDLAFIEDGPAPPKR